MLRALLLAILLFPILTPSNAFAAMPRSPVGVWMFEDGESAVELYQCGDHLCGRTVWMIEDRGPDGQPLLDRNNRDVALRARPLCGLEFITGLKQKGGASWEDGKIYGVDQGRDYDVEIRQTGANELVLRGFDGLRILGQNFTLTRARADLPRCKDFGAPIGTR